MKKAIIVTATDRGLALALTLQAEIPKSIVATTRPSEDPRVTQVPQLSSFVAEYYNQANEWIFITALGVCVRLIAPHLGEKNNGPAVVCMDDHGQMAQPVVGGHMGGANVLAKKVAHVFGAQCAVSTSSDLQGIWALDTLGQQFGWETQYTSTANQVMATFVNNEPVALLLETRDKGTEHLENTLPGFVEVFYHENDIPYDGFKLLIAVTYRRFDVPIPAVFYYPKVLAIGSGCSKSLDPALFSTTLMQKLVEHGLSPHAIKSLGSVDIKAAQSAYLEFSESNDIPFHTFDKAAIDTVEVPNPSPTVQSKIGVAGVAEPTAMLMAGNTQLLVTKQKVLLDNGEKFTFAVALLSTAERKAAIAIVGAGPGDEELISVKGKNLLAEADLVLYAGSLVPEGLLNWCKPKAVIRNSASMDLEAQITLMQDHYQKGHKIVRLHSGDPSLYGAIQEQMTCFDELGMQYYIVPGISAFNAAAAVLKSEFTVPEIAQTVILTRGEGKTPMPPNEKLEEMAKAQATMCLFLSVGIAKKVENQLLMHYGPDTPVAVLYRLTWPDEEVHTGVLKDLVSIVKQSKKTRTVLIVVGHAIHARANRSKLYDKDWKHIFRTGKAHQLKTVS